MQLVGAARVEAPQRQAMLRLGSLLLLVPAALGQTAWYVDVAATPPGTGTLSDPYASIQYAIDQVTTVYGDTLAVAPGTYVENLQFKTKSILVLGTGGPGVTTIRPAGMGHVVDMNGSYSALEGFTITGGLQGTPHASGVRVTFATESPRIERCVIAGNAGHGLTWRSSGLSGLIRHCTIVFNGRQGLRMTHGSGADVENCIDWGNVEDASFSFGPHPQGGFWYNDFQDNPFTPSSLTAGNFEASPDFWDPLGGDYRLKPGSPCIDAGAPWGTPDPDGSLPDVGAFTYDPAYAPPPTPYCTAKVNSKGCTPAIGSVGAASAAGAPFDVTCSNVLNNKNGLLFYGYTPKATPYQGGWLCVLAPVKRTATQSSGGNPPPDDCSGFYTFDFDARIQSGVDPALAAGAMVYAQYWFRDPQQAVTTGRSDALSFGIRP